MAEFSLPRLLTNGGCFPVMIGVSVHDRSAVYAALNIDFLHKSLGVPPHGDQDDRKFLCFLESAGMGWMRWELP